MSSFVIIFILVVVRRQCYSEAVKIINVKNIAALVKQERKRRGWTQAELAMHSGVSRDWVIGLEKAKPTVELSLVLRTLKALRINLDAIISDDTLNHSSHKEIINSLNKDSNLSAKHEK